MIEARCTRKHEILKVEHLAHWYLRLNGFMTINDFVLHPDRRGGQRTDADVFGVRFPFRKELDFDDDALFTECKNPHFIIGEITQGPCKLNGPWTRPADENMQYVLNAMGAFEPKAVDGIAQSLYERQNYEDDICRIDMIAFGRQEWIEGSNSVKPQTQITFDHVARFIFQRFIQYWYRKKDHQHWDFAGQSLWDLTEQHLNSEETFVEDALRAFGIGRPSYTL